MRRVFDTMGTTASLSSERPAPLADIQRVFSSMDRRFSLFSPESELSRIAAGELRLDDAGAAVLEIYSEAIEWRRRTDGAFSPHRPDGVLDLNGIVKAAAMREAAEVLDKSECGQWTLVVGGDLVAAPVDPQSDHGIIGIVDPADRNSLVCSVVLKGTRRAVATSGSAERGDHIWLGGQVAPAEYVQATVIADDVVTADVLATAIIAGGRDALDDLCERFPIDVLTIDRAGDLRATPGFAGALPNEASVALHERHSFDWH